MFALPHHVDSMLTGTAKQLSTGDFRTSRGPMTGILEDLIYRFGFELISSFCWINLGLE